MTGRCGEAKASDAVVVVNLDHEGRSIEIKSKLKDMFGKLMEEAVTIALDEMEVMDAHVSVEDFGALDFIIKARTKTALRRAMAKGGSN